MPAPAQLDPPVASAHARLRLAVAGLLTVAAAALVLVPGLQAHADQTPAASANQSTSLIDQQVIEVSVSGLSAGSQAFLRQCSAAPVTVQGDCSGNAASPVTIGDDGTGRDVVQLSVGAIATNATCDAAHACSIQVLSNPSKLPGLASIPIAFAPTNGNCPSYPSQAAGLGSSAANRAFIGWVPTTCQAPYSDSIDWSTGNDVDGRKSLTNGSRDWAVSERSLDPTLNKTTASFSYAPLTLSALGFAYNLRDRTTGERITDLRLTPQLLIELLKGELTTWQDSRVEQLNPNHDFPVTAKAIARADACNASLAVTSWFETIDKADYESGNPVYKAQGKTDLFPVPRANSTLAVTGEAAVLSDLTNPKLADSNYDPASEGVLGYLDTSVAAISSLPTVTIVTDTTKSTADVSATPATVLAGLAHMQPDANGVLAANYSTADSTSTSYDYAAYPLPTVTYAILPTSGTTAAKAGWLKSFFSFATGNSGSGNGQDTGLSRGYVPLTSALRSASAAAISAITVTPVATPSASPTTSPTAVAPAPGTTSAAPVLPAASTAPAVTTTTAATPAVRRSTPPATARPTTAAATSPAPTVTSVAPTAVAPTGQSGATAPVVTAPIDQQPAQAPVDQVPVDTGGATLPATDQSAAAPDVATSGEPVQVVTAPLGTAAPTEQLADVKPAAFARDGGSGASLLLPVLVLLALAGLLAGPVLLRRGGAA